MTTVPPPPSLDAIGRRVSARIDTLLADEQARWVAVDPDLDEMWGALRRLAAGGKRLRPAFCHWGFVGAGGSPSDPRIVDAGAAVEMLHTFALIHDDIMDDSSRRHGVPCLHVDFAERHRQRAWSGEARRFGDGAAILIGDMAFVYADVLLAAAGPSPDALRIFTDLRLEVNVGQLLDLVGSASRKVSVEQARTICVYKSGKYTIERPLQLGAALAQSGDAGGGDAAAGDAGAGDAAAEDVGRLMDAYTAYGIPLGEAFQLRDDLLGAFGDGSRLGKNTGDDIRDGKPTALYALALAAASATAPLARYGQPDLTDDEVTAIQQVFVDSGARAEIEAQVERLTTSALASLDSMPVPAGVRSELEALARFVAGRDF